MNACQERIIKLKKVGWNSACFQSKKNPRGEGKKYFINVLFKLAPVIQFRLRLFLTSARLIFMYFNVLCKIDHQKYPW